MQIFPEFSPEAVQHEFGSGFTSGIFCNESWIEVDVFSLLVTSDVILFLFSSGHVAGVPCRFLLDFEPSVDVFGKEPCFSLVRWEMPDFVDLDDSVSHFDGFDEFWGAPGPTQLSLFGRVSTMVRFFQEAFRHFLFDATLAEGNSEFATVSVW